MVVRSIFVFSVLVCALWAQSLPMRSYGGPLPGGSGVRGRADFDLDGDVDVLADRRFLLNDGHGNFSAGVPSGLAAGFDPAAVADLNGDGYPDVVTVMTQVATLQLHFGGAGLVLATQPAANVPAFSAPVGAPQFAARVATSDVDGDGDVDLVVGGYAFVGGAQTPMPPVLLLNNGSGVFVLAPAAALAAAPPTRREWLTDVDGDGDEDLLIETTGAGAAGQWLANNGGSFSPPVALGGAPYFFTTWAFGDFDGNGITDIARPGSAGTSVHFGSAAGPGPAVTTPSLVGPAPHLQAVDLDGDLRDELLVGGLFGGFTVHTVTTAGALSAPTQTVWGDFLEGVRPFDVDGDGDLDVFARDVIHAMLFMNDGAGGLVRHGPNVIPPGTHLVGDLDQDGDVDALQVGLASIWTFANDGDGRFSPGATSGYAGLGNANPVAHLFDFDGDADPDVYIARGLTNSASGFGTDVVLSNVGGTLTPTLGLVDNGPVSVVRSADVDGDGDLDVILGRRESPVVVGSGAIVGSVRLVRNLGGSFAAPVDVAGTGATSELVVADFDGDGDVDVIQTHQTPSAGVPTQLLVNDGSGAFTSLALPMIVGISAVAGDLTGDGLAEVVTESRVWINMGGGTFSAGPLLPTSLIESAALEDVDGDGDLDLIERGGAVFSNAGGGVFMFPLSQYGRPALPFLAAADVTVADLDRDGDPDLIGRSGRVFFSTERQIEQRVPARPGRPFALDLYGAAGGGYSLYASLTPAQIPVPPFGVVGLDPTSAVLIQVGSLSNQIASVPGRATLSFTLPNLPGLAGTTVYWQMLDATPRLSNRVRTTVQGY